jgi:hypothetical protein
MDGSDHYRRAEELAAKAEEYLEQGDGQGTAAVWAAVAQVHAIFALDLAPAAAQRAIRRRCQASKVPGVTGRLPRRADGSRRARAARTARSAQSGRAGSPGRRSTITSCRRTRISASFDAWLRPSRTSQPHTRTMTKYSRRKDTNRDHAPAHQPSQIAAHRPARSSEAVQGHSRSIALAHDHGVVAVYSSSTSPGVSTAVPWPGCGACRVPEQDMGC